MTAERWAALMASFHIGAHRDTYERLLAAYAEPHRCYHTAKHILACLAELDCAREIATAPHEVEIAIWFHDAIYEPLSDDNERLSAEWAATFLRHAGAPQEQQRRVYDHVMATVHATPPASGDAALVVDIDLAIFGKPAAVYARFERDVRREYRAVSDDVYRRERTRLLASFLARGSIYNLGHFRERYEVTARRNLERAIRTLRDGERGPLP